VFIATLPLFHAYGMIVNTNIGLYVGLQSIVMQSFDFEKYLSLIPKYKVTHLHVVPPIMILLEKHPLVQKYDLSSLKHILSGAASLSPEIELKVKKRLPWLLSIKQAYGMSELSPVSHYAPKNQPLKPGSVGKLVPNLEAKIVNVETGKELGVNEEGELWIKGPSVMLGYYGMPKDTADTIDKDGFLHTGDVAKIDQDGFFYIVDRLKELIKYKGLQVAPAELEAILLDHPSIADAAVIPVPNDEAGEVPKAFVVVKEGKTLVEREVVEYVEKRVAHHKRIRGGVEFIAQIPKSASGKILRRILRDKQKQPSRL